MASPRSRTSARSTAATSGSTSGCDISARASSGWMTCPRSPDPQPRGIGAHMVDRIPSGTRDVLPDEMRELRALTERIRGVFERSGYGEVYTPVLEYEGTFTKSDASNAVSKPAYRMFDEQGNVLVLR